MKMRKILYQSLLCSVVLFSPYKVHATGAEWFAVTAVAAWLGGRAIPDFVSWVWNNPNEFSRRVKILGNTIFCCGRRQRDPELVSPMSYLYPAVMPYENVRLLNITCNSLERVAPAQFRRDLGDGYEYRTQPYNYQLRRARASDPTFEDRAPSQEIQDFMYAVRSRARATGILPDAYFERIERAHRTIVDGFRLVHYAMVTPNKVVAVRIHGGEDQIPFIFQITRNEEDFSAAPLLLTAPHTDTEPHTGARALPHYEVPVDGRSVTSGDWDLEGQYAAPPPPPSSPITVPVRSAAHLREPASDGDPVLVRPIPLNQHARVIRVSHSVPVTASLVATAREAAATTLERRDGDEFVEIDLSTPPGPLPPVALAPSPADVDGRDSAV